MSIYKTYQMNPAAIAIALTTGKKRTPLEMSLDNIPRRPSWIKACLFGIGVIMSNPEQPRGWSFNPSVATLFLVILGMVAGGAYYVGVRDTEAKHLLERVVEAEKIAIQAKDLALPVAINGGHPTNTEDKNKKEKK